MRLLSDVELAFLTGIVAGMLLLYVLLQAGRFVRSLFKQRLMKQRLLKPIHPRDETDA